jgi:ribosomal protein L35AE/L33A
MTKQEAVDYFNTHGYYIVTSPGQQELADQLVADGLLRQADPSWFLDPADNLYVHASVDCKEKMPLSLRKLVCERQFSQGEFVRVKLVTTRGQDVYVVARFLRQFTSRDNQTLLEVSVNNCSFCVPIADVSHTFVE